jgi:hypothetical protein
VARPPSKRAFSPVDLQLADDIGRFFYDPLGFVRYVFPWGEEQTPLAQYKGPDTWQAELLNYVGTELRTSKKVVRAAVSSGHGIGKSSTVSWLIHWFMSTRPHCAIVATANTKTQLQSKLWRELALWHKRSLNQHWFDWMATSYRSAESPATWVADAIPWSENNPEAFAGLHAEHVMVIFDEASAIHEKIWEVVEGAFTTQKVLFVVLGNPTRSSGAFFECFHSRKHLWKTFQVDSRTAMMTNKDQLAEWIDTYGEDSDFARVRIYGQFPRVGDVQFIPTDLVERAQKASVPTIEDDYLVLGVDVARFGSDATVVTWRSSNRVELQQEFRGLDTMQVAAKVAEIINDDSPDTVFVDGVGLGAGVVDRLRQLNFRVVDVQSAAKADDPTYQNKRAEMWGNLKTWLRGDVKLPADGELKSQLIAVEYGINNRGLIQLESKADMKKRGLDSPDRADSLALTFAEPVKRVRYDAAEMGYYSLNQVRSRLDWRTV